MSVDIVKNMSLTMEDKVSVPSGNNKIIIEPIKEKKVFDIKKLVSKIPSNYKAVENIYDIYTKEEW